MRTEDRKKPKGAKGQRGGIRPKNQNIEPRGLDIGYWGAIGLRVRVSRPVG